MKKPIILTGGVGFIGSVFLWKLNKKGLKNIIVVDHLDETDKWRNLLNKHILDYIDKDDFIKLVKRGRIHDPGYVVHMGACSSTTLDDEAYFKKNNYEYSKRLAKWAIEKGAPFMYASSAATYGDGSMGFSDSDMVSPGLKPLNLYGQSKQFFDTWVLKNRLQNRLTGIKFFNVFGPNEYHKGEMMSVICKKFNDVKEKGKITLFKSYKKGFKHGEQKRDFIYVKDAVDAMYYLFKNPKITGIFNLGTGKARTWNDIARSMFKALGKRTRIKYIEMPRSLRSRYQYFTEARMDKLKAAGYKSKFHSLEETVKDYTSYLKKGKFL